MKREMRYIIRYYLICTFLCAPFFSKAQEKTGDSLLAIGDFRRAAVAYELAIFRGVDPLQAQQILVKEAQCLKQQGRYDQALVVLDGADFYLGKDSSRFLLFYEYAINSMLAKKYDLALSKMEEMRYELKDTSRMQVILPLEIISLNELGRYKEAQKKFKRMSTLYGSTEDPYTEILEFKPKNPDKAVTLSYIFPGVGQMYAGYFWKGFVSTLLNVGLVGFSTWSFLNHYFFSGAFTGVALFYLSYNGGARYAEGLAKRYNEEHTKEFNAKIKKLVVSWSLK